VFRGRSKREVEDIILSDGRDRGVSRNSGHTPCAKRSKREQGREKVYQKVQVSTKISRNRAF
jgi:hypothetical protein